MGPYTLTTFPTVKSLFDNYKNILLNGKFKILFIICLLLSFALQIFDIYNLKKKRFTLVHSQRLWFVISLG